MSVHFDFILSDTDAENLMDFINNEKVRCLERRMESTAQGNKINSDAYLRAAEYVEKLKSKMTNSYCED
jgi:hypothetical protein